jgi:hypothetical protein
MTQVKPGFMEDRYYDAWFRTDETDFEQWCTATKEMTMGPRDRELCLACHIK